MGRLATCVCAGGWSPGQSGSQVLGTAFSLLFPLQPLPPLPLPLLSPLPPRLLLPSPSLSSFLVLNMTVISGEKGNYLDLGQEGEAHMRVVEVSKRLWTQMWRVHPACTGQGEAQLLPCGDAAWLCRCISGIH